MKIKRKYIGKWRLLEMSAWDREFIDLVAPGHLTVKADGTGLLAFGAMEAELDCRLEETRGEERLGFSFAGWDEGDEISGRGWLTVDGEGEGVGMGRQPELTGGGLIRSKGGWSQVVSARRSGQKEEYDERILGSGDFVNAALKEAEEATRLQLKIRRTGGTLAKIIEEECGPSNVSPQELKGGSRRRAVSGLRIKIAKRGLGELGLSLAEIARHVGVSTSGIARAIKR